MERCALLSKAWYNKMLKWDEGQNPSPLISHVNKQVVKCIHFPFVFWGQYLANLYNRIQGHSIYEHSLKL